MGADANGARWVAADEVSRKEAAEDGGLKVPRGQFDHRSRQLAISDLLANGDQPFGVLGKPKDRENVGDELAE